MVFEIYEDRYEEAVSELDLALKHCPESAYYNRRRILGYLIPLQMARGKLPTTGLLDKYQLEEFKGVRAALISGDLGAFNRAVQVLPSSCRVALELQAPKHIEHRRGCLQAGSS